MPHRQRRSAKIAQAGAESFEAIAYKWLEQTSGKRVANTNETMQSAIGSGPAALARKAPHARDFRA
jgi:hypothetical protein